MNKTLYLYLYLYLYHHYDKETLTDITIDLIESKNYDKLSILSSSHKFNSHIAISEAINNLDLKAISTILKYTNFDNPNKKIRIKNCI